MITNSLPLTIAVYALWALIAIFVIVVVRDIVRIKRNDEDSVEDVIARASEDQNRVYGL